MAIRGRRTGSGEIPDFFSMSVEELQDFIEENDLEVDLEEYDTRNAKRRAVRTAWEEANGGKKTSRETSKKETLMEKVLRTKKELEDRQGNYFKPKDGKNIVRIMPSWRGVEEVFYLQVPTHNNIGPDGKWATCLQFWDEVCPIDSTIKELASSNLASDQATAAKMVVKDRFLVNVGYPNEADGVVKPWSMSESWFLEILSDYGNSDYGDFTDVRKGHDYSFTRTGTGLATKYTNKKFVPKSSRLIIDDYKKKLINLDAFIKHYTRKELRGFLRGDEE